MKTIRFPNLIIFKNNFKQVAELSEHLYFKSLTAALPTTGSADPLTA